MPRAFGLFARTLFGINGLLTVWCLGCCGFEPLLTGGNPRMAQACAAEATEPSPSDAPVVSAEATCVPDFTCGCESCCAVSAVRLAFTAGTFEHQALPVSMPDELFSISTEPQYPPPRPQSLRA